MSEPIFKELVKQMLSSPEAVRSLDKKTSERLEQLLSAEKLPSKDDLTAVIGIQVDENPKN